MATLGAFAFFCSPALALKSSPSALRLEDKKSGHVLLGADAAEIEAGEIYRTVVLIWGKLDIYGQVDDVLVLSGHVVFHEGAKLNKSLIMMDGSYEAKPGAALNYENLTFRAPGPFWRMLRSLAMVWRENVNWIVFLLYSLLTSLLLWGMGYLLFAAMPRLRQATVGKLWAEWPRNLFVGLLGSLLVPMLFALLLISIFGILLLPLYFLFLFAAGTIAYLAAACWAGHRIWPAQEPGKLRGLSLLVGILAFQLFWATNVWWAVLPLFFLWTLGWGALLRGLRTLWR